MPPQKKRQNSVDKDGTGDDLKKPKLVQTDEEHEDEEESSEESDSKSDDGSEDEANKEKGGLPFANKSPKESLIKMTFEFNDIKEDYAEGITLMLKDFVPISHQRYQLAVEITKFVVGTAVVCEGADDVFAFTSAVPMTAPICQASDGLGGLLVHLKRVLGGKDKGSRFESILSSLPGNPSAEKTCLLVHERFTNLPLELICPLHSNLLEDLQWSAHSTIPECQAFQGIDSLLLLAPMAQSEGIPSGCMDVTGSSSIMYDRFDDEIFAQQAKQVALFHAPSSGSAAGKAFAAMLIPVDSLAGAIKEIEPFTQGTAVL